MVWKTYACTALGCFPLIKSLNVFEPIFPHLLNFKKVGTGVFKGLLCVKIPSFLSSRKSKIWLTVIDLLMSEPGLVDGRLSLPSPIPVVEGPWELAIFESLQYDLLISGYPISWGRQDFTVSNFLFPWYVSWFCISRIPESLKKFWSSIFYTIQTELISML